MRREKENGGATLRPFSILAVQKAGQSWAVKPRLSIHSSDSLSFHSTSVIFRVTVKPGNRDDFFKSMTMYSQMSAPHFRLQLTTIQLCCADGPNGRNNNRTVRSITSVLPLTASHNISTSSGLAKSANPQLSSSCGYCSALVSHQLWLLIFSNGAFLC